VVRVAGVLEPTLAGQALVDGASRLLDEGATLLAHAREVGTEPSGTLRIALQCGFPHAVAIQGSQYLQASYPRLSIELRAHVLKGVPRVKAVVEAVRMLARSDDR
jgi:DNA-binding transcriptional LysR family regulator